MMNKEYKSAFRCPVVINLESRYVMVRVLLIYTLALRAKDGKPVLRNLLGSKAAAQ